MVKTVKVKFKEKISAEIKIFLANFKIETSFFKLCVYDLLYYATFAVLLIFLSKFIGPKYVQMQQMLSLSQAGDIAQLQAYASSIKSLVVSLIVIPILLVLLLLGSYCFFKGIIWAKIYHQQLTIKKYFRFMLATVIMLTILIIFILVVTLIQNKITSGILLFFLGPFILVYVGSILHAMAVKEDSTKISLKKGFVVMLTKIHYYIVPYILLWTMLFIISMFLNSLVFLQGLFSTFIYVLFYIVFSTFLKLYLSKILNLIESA